MLKLTSEVLMKQHGESQRTPPLGEPSLHRRNSSVGRPRGILGLFVTSLRAQVKSHFVSRVVFLTVNHHGSLSLRELHSTDEIIAWGDLGGSWACMFMIMCEITLLESALLVTLKSMCACACECVHVWVCVCECVWERETERDREKL